MKGKIGVWPVLGVLLGAMLVLTACGGGGGGSSGSGGGSEPVVPASYDGETAQAIITADNAVTIVGNAWGFGVNSRDSIDVVPLAENGAEPAAAPLVPTRMTAEFAAAMAAEIEMIIKPAATETGAIPGGCGGSATYTITLNEVTFDFNGQFTFTNYCELTAAGQSTANGLVGISGHIDPQFLIITAMRMNFDNLSIVEGGEAYTITEGRAGFVLSADLSQETDTLNLVLRDDIQQKSYWVNNYVIVITLINDFEDSATISGRFYDYDHGYVDLSTLTPLVVAESVLGGEMLFTGDESRAKLTFLADQTTLLEVDADNDGIYEVTILNPVSSM